MFKFFDTQNKGYVNFDEFARVLEKAGMYYPNPTLSQLFTQYDT